MAVKCNITTLALEELGVLLWGFECKNNTGAIIENYLEYLNCPDVKYSVCHEDIACTPSQPVDFHCRIAVVNISYLPDTTTAPEDVIFSLGITDTIGATQPLSYHWYYDASDFDLISADVLQPTIRLKLKAGKVLALVVSSVSVGITDASGCFVLKQCWFTGTGMRCSVNYAPCRNPQNLSVAYSYVPCPKPKTLTVV